MHGVCDRRAEVYRSRFMEAMQRYFLRVPDPWSSVRILGIVHAAKARPQCNCCQASDKE